MRLYQGTVLERKNDKVFDFLINMYLVLSVLVFALYI